jgi:hypothetical protein
MTRKQTLFLLVGLTILGFALRLYHIDTPSFRGDEAFTVLNWVNRPLHETLSSEIPLKDPQPPLGFALFRGWFLLLGAGELSMRVLPALVGTLVIPAAYVLGKRLSGQQAGALAALLISIHPFLIWHAQDARVYAIWSALSALALWLALVALQRQRLIDWFLYIILALCAVYTYYLELFVLAALNIYVFSRYWLNRPLLLRWIVSQGIIGLGIAPWFLQERLLFDSGYSGTTQAFDPLRVLNWLIPALNFGLTMSSDFLSWIALPVIGVLLAGLYGYYRSDRSRAFLLALVAFLPVILLSAVSLRLNVFTPRYVLSSAVLYIILITAVALKLKSLRRPIGQTLALIFTALWIVVSLISLKNYFFSHDYAKSPDWRGLSAYLHSHANPADLVVQAAADEAFTLYFDTFSPSERLPASPHQPVDEIITILQQAAAQPHSIWLVARTPADWPNATTAPAWLQEHMQEVRRTAIGTLPIQQFMPWDVLPHETNPAPLAQFSEIAQVMGYRIDTEDANTLLVWVYWQPLSQMAFPLKAFLHLSGPPNSATGSPIWAQDDHFPPHALTNTKTWSTDQVYRDIYRLSLTNVPPGSYQLLLGLYHPETGQRIPLGHTDSYKLTDLTLPFS